MQCGIALCDTNRVVEDHTLEAGLASESNTFPLRHQARWQNIPATADCRADLFMLLITRVSNGGSQGQGAGVPERRQYM